MMKITRISYSFSFFNFSTFNFYGSNQHGLVFLASGMVCGGSNNVWVLVTVAFICFIDYDDVMMLIVVDMGLSRSNIISLGKFTTLFPMEKKYMLKYGAFNFSVYALDYFIIHLGFPLFFFNLLKKAIDTHLFQLNYNFIAFHFFSSMCLLWCYLHLLL